MHVSDCWTDIGGEHVHLLRNSAMIIRDILFKIKDKFLQGSGRTSEP